MADLAGSSGFDSGEWGQTTVPNSKWGRHSCRPHSHRRVDAPTLARLPANLPPCLCQRILGARCLASRAQSCDRGMRGFVTGARAGIRLSLLPCRVLSKPKGSGVRHHAQVPGRDRVLLPDRPPAGWGLSPFHWLFIPAKFPACPVTPRRARLKQGRLHLAEASYMPSLNRCVDRCLRHPWDKNQHHIKALRLSVRHSFCPEDN